ncbi:MAG: integrase arm-type DNA-binding domain-containing protein [Rhodomicrobium sp.]
MPLTDTAIKAAKPREKAYKLSDGGGMFLLVRPDGSKYWRLKYRFADKEKLLALGVYGTGGDKVSLKEARDRRGAARSLLKEGKDPAGERKAAKAAERGETAFEAVAREYAEKQKNRWSESHHRSFVKRLEADIFPAIGKKPIAEIEAPDLLDALRKVERRGSYDTSHRLVQRCGAVFRYGIATGRCKRDVAADLRGALTPHKVKHMAAVKPEELPALLHKIDGYEGELQTCLGLRLLALTFVRTGELIAAEWPEFNMDERLWLIPAERTKRRREHLVPLSRQAVAILEELRRLNGSHHYVFPGRNRVKHISQNTLIFALYRLGYHKLMTGHGFRTLASTILNEARKPTGERLFHVDVIERQLAHTELNRVRAAYDRSEHLPERATMMQWWADHLDGLRCARM